MPRSILAWVNRGPRCMLTSMADSKATARRRWIGGLLLLSAAVTLIAGETLLKERLKDLTFLLYWLLCLVFTGAAIIVAFLDARDVHRKSRREARELIESTVNKIEVDARQKPRRDDALNS